MSIPRALGFTVGGALLGGISGYLGSRVTEYVVVRLGVTNDVKPFATLFVFFVGTVACPVALHVLAWRKSGASWMWSLIIVRGILAMAGSSALVAFFYLCAFGGPCE